MMNSTDFQVGMTFSVEASFSLASFFELRSVIHIKAINAAKSINASIRDMLSSSIMKVSMIEATIAIGMSLLTVAR